MKFRRTNRSQTKLVVLDAAIITNPLLSLDAIGYYALLEADGVELQEIPTKILKEMAEVGYLKEIR